MRLLICRCNGQINIPDPRVEPGTTVEWFDSFCARPPAVDPDEKVVIAGCSPSVMEGLFPGASAEFVNLKEHVVLLNHPVAKAHALIAAALAQARHTLAPKKRVFPIKNRRVAIIGGGIAGIETARIVSAAGIPVTIIEKTPFLGGTVSKLDRLYPEGTPCSHTVTPLVNTLLGRQNIEFLLGTTLESASGQPGDYRLAVSSEPRGVIECNECGRCVDVCPVSVVEQGKVRKAIYYQHQYPFKYAVDFDDCNRCGECRKVCPGRIELDAPPVRQEIAAGAVVVATGLNFYDLKKVEEYGYGTSPAIMDALEFERAVTSEGLKPKKVALVCCAGSRDVKHLEYCSKICCFLALKEAKLVKDRFPDTEVYVAAMDMRSYGNFEYFYNKLRQMGVVFLKGKPSEIFPKNGGVIVRTEDLYTNELLDVAVDTVVLSAGFVPDQETFGKFSIGLRGNFPVLYQASEIANLELPRGLFTAGSASFPGGAQESLGDARKTAGAVIEFIGRERIETRQPMALVDPDLCSVCRLCINTCPYSAILLVDDKIKIREDLCMGCGICSITCPSFSSQLENFNPAGVHAAIRSMVQPGDILAMLCRWSAYPATDAAAYEKLDYPAGVKIMRVPCTGAVDPSFVVAALERGARGVLIGGCYPDSCHYARGNFRARARERMLAKTLELLGLRDKTVRLEWIGKDEAKKFVALVKEMNARGA